MNRKQLLEEAQEFLIHYYLKKIADNRNHALTCECTGVPLCTLCKANKLVHDIDHLPLDIPKKVSKFKRSYPRRLV